MTEEGEPGASVHLPLDHLRLCVDSFGAAVVEGHGERRCCGLDVQVQSAGEGVDMGQVSGPGGGDPLLQSPGVAWVRDQEGREAADWLARALISGQAASMRASVSCWLPVRRSGLVSRSRVARRGDRCGRSPSSRP